MAEWAWYYIVFTFAVGIFLIRGLLSFIVGEIEVDFDIDGDVDSDIASMLSFKGLVHFIMGFSTYLSVVGYLNTENLNTIYNFSTVDYCIATVTGIVFTLLLFYLYKWLMKVLNDNGNTNEDFSFIGLNGTIAIDNGDGTYVVNVSTPFGVRQLGVRDFEENGYSVGDYVTIRAFDKEKLIYLI